MGHESTPEALILLCESVVGPAFEFEKPNEIDRLSVWDANGGRIVWADSTAIECFDVMVM